MRFPARDNSWRIRLPGFSALSSREPLPETGERPIDIACGEGRRFCSWKSLAHERPGQKTIHGPGSAILCPVVPKLHASHIDNVGAIRERRRANSNPASHSAAFPHPTFATATSNLEDEKRETTDHAPRNSRESAMLVSPCGRESGPFFRRRPKMTISPSRGSERANGRLSDGSLRSFIQLFDIRGRRFSDVMLPFVALNSFEAAVIGCL